MSVPPPLNLPGEKSITITWDRGEKLLTPYVGLSAWRDNTQCGASSLDKKFVRKVAAVDRRARPRPLCNSAPLETETYAKPPFLPQMMQPWTHCLNQKENERPSSLSFLPCLLPASLCTIIAELLTSSFDGSMRRDIRANNQLLNLTNF